MRAFGFRREESADWRQATRVVLALSCLLPAVASGDPQAPPQDPAAAGEPAPAPPVRRIGEVTATATRGEREVLDVPGNVTVIDRDEIERSGARTLPDLLRREPGIFVTNTSTNPAGTFVDARGFNNGGGNGAGLLVLVDGRRANEPDLGAVDWALLPLDMIESVEIVRGPASPLYGDGAVGGVLHIRTRPAEGPPRGALRGVGGRYGTAGGSLRAAGSFGDVTGGLYVNGLATDGYRKRAGYEAEDVKVTVEGTLLDRLVVGSSGGWHRDDREFPGGLTHEEIAERGRRAAAPFASKDRAEVDTWSWDGWVEAAIEPDLEIRVLPYFSSRDQFARQSGIDFGGEIDTEKLQGGVDLQVRLDRPVGDLRNRLIVGATYLHDEVDRTSRFTFFGFPSDNRTRGSRNVAGGFLQEELWILEDLLLGAGVRYDSAGYDLRRDDASGTQKQSPDLHAWSPKASLTWRFAPVASAYLAYSRGFRMPDFDEDIPFVGPLPDLEPLRSDSYELGAKLDSERARAGLSLYWMSVHDEVLLDPSSFANRNLDRVRHRGIELSGSYRAFEWLTLTGAYTFDDVKIVKDDNPALDGARIPVTPKHRGSLGAIAEFPIGFEQMDAEIVANANLVGERILANDFQRDFAALDAYATLDLWLRLRRDFGQRLRATLSFGVRNVTGERYEEIGSCNCLNSFGSPLAKLLYPAPTRTWELGLLVELGP